MASVKKFEDLDVWQEARALVSAIYKTIKGPALSKDFALQDFIDYLQKYPSNTRTRRAVSHVPS